MACRTAPSNPGGSLHTLPPFRIFDIGAHKRRFDAGDAAPIAASDPSIIERLTMNTSTPKASPLARIALAFALVLGLFAVGSLVVPGQAQALEVTQCTAAPNEDGGNQILGGAETRITWRGQAAEDESVSSIVLTMPEGLQFDADGVKVTGLDELDRVELNAQITIPGDGTMHIDFPEPAPAGLSFLVETYGATFPTEGGTFTVSTQITDADGTVSDLGPSSEIQVAGLSKSEQLSSWLEGQEWVQAWNSNRFLHMFFDPTLIVTSIPSVAQGWVTALGIVIIAFPLAIVVGFLLALLRMSKLLPLRAIASLYVNIVRGTPMFLQIYIAFFGLPLLGVNVDNFALGCIVMALNSCAYLCEIFRAGIQSINKGQFEAARSLGMSAPQTMLSVIIPQAFRNVIPTMTNELITLYKDTSLLAAVGIMETVMYAKTITAATGNITPYIVAALFYLVVTLPMTAITRRMETGSTKKSSKKGKGLFGKSSSSDKGSWTPATDGTSTKLEVKQPDYF